MTPDDHVHARNTDTGNENIEKIIIIKDRQTSSHQ